MIPISFYMLMFIFAGCGGNDSSSGTKVEAAQVSLNLQQAQELAKKESKKVILDVYTDWCGYCRRMISEVYPSDEVQSVVGDYYYVVRVNAESSKEIWFNGKKYTEQSLARSFGVSSFPTTVFVGSDGVAIGVQPGFMEAPIFSKLLEFVGSDAYKTMSFDEFESRS